MGKQLRPSRAAPIGCRPPRPGEAGLDRAGPRRSPSWGSGRGRQRSGGEGQPGGPVARCGVPPARRGSGAGREPAQVSGAAGRGRGVSSRWGREETEGEQERARKKTRGARGRWGWRWRRGGRGPARFPGNYTCRPDSITGSPLAATLRLPRDGPGAIAHSRCRLRRGGRPRSRGVTAPRPFGDCGSRRRAGSCGPRSGPGNGLGRGDGDSLSDLPFLEPRGAGGEGVRHCPLPIILQNGERRKLNPAEDR